MIRKRQLTLNSLAAAVQVAITGVVFIFLYRFVKDQVGIDRFGIWSVVLIAATVSSMANLGLGSSVVKFVAKYRARDDAPYAAQVVQTAMLTLAVLLTVMLSLFYPVAIWALSVHPKLAAAPAYLAEAYAILPFAFASFWMLSVAGVALGTIDGHQRIDLRSALQVASTLGYLGATLLLVPHLGLLGLAWAHITQAGLLLVSAWIMSLRLLPTLPVLPCRWQWRVLKEILGYSANFQVMSIFWLLLEPLTRWLVSVFGGLGAAGWFEFANRMVFQIRALIVVAHQSVVPTIADLVERQVSMINTIYRSSFRIMLFVVSLLLPLMISLTPLVSRLWLGQVEPIFVTFASLLFAGWLLNLLSNPAYFAYMGIGTLRWNVAGRIVMGTLNAVLSWLLGTLLGGTGVIIGFVVALAVGSMVTALAYHREYAIRLRDLWDQRSTVLGVVGVTLLVVCWPMMAFLQEMIWLAPALLALVTGCIAWPHPVRRDLRRWLADLSPRAA